MNCTKRSERTGTLGAWRREREVGKGREEERERGEWRGVLSMVVFWVLDHNHLADSIRFWTHAANCTWRNETANNLLWKSFVGERVIIFFLMWNSPSTSLPPRALTYVYVPYCILAKWHDYRICLFDIVQKHKNLTFPLSCFCDWYQTCPEFTASQSPQIGKL